MESLHFSYTWPHPNIHYTAKYTAPEKERKREEESCRKMFDSQKFKQHANKCLSQKALILQVKRENPEQEVGSV